jgi:DivIVA domain-containing protein
VVWLLGILAVLVLGAVVVVAAGRGAGMSPAYDDRPDLTVPADRPLTGGDLRGVRFSVGLRGYRMDEVDALLARLAEQLDDRTAADRTAADRAAPPADAEESP